MKSEPPVVSVIVPTRNEARSIDACLAALTSLDAFEAIEILVVDGMSDDDTAARVRDRAAQDSRIRLLENPARITPAALNIGVRSARAAVIARMDGHTEAPHDYISRGLELLGKTSAWCVGGSMQRVGSDRVSGAIARATMSPFGVGDAVHNYSEEPGWVETAFLGMWPRWVFDRIGLFDEELVRNQDDEFSFRIRSAGGGIWMDPSISMRYTPRSSYGAFFSQYREYALWKVRVFQKHPRAARLRHLIPAIWVGAIALGLLLTPLSPAGPILAGLAVGAYIVVMGAASWRLRDGDVRARDVFRALATLHTAYGVGLLQGLIRFAPRWIRDRQGRLERLEPLT